MNLTWSFDYETGIHWLYAADTRVGYVKHHARSTAKTPTYVGVVLGGVTKRKDAHQVTRTFGGEPTVAAAKAAVIKEIA